MDECGFVLENWNVCVEGAIIGWENTEANYSRPLLKLLDTTTKNAHSRIEDSVVEEAC